MPFKALNLSDSVLRGVQAAGYTDPTPIQLRAIPVVLGGGDLIGSAQTGTGKTAAFALPILTRLGGHKGPNARVLVLEPTRELAAQVETAFRDFARFTDMRAVAIFGGVGYGNQRAELRRGVDIIVATPGRLMDYLQEGTISLRDISILVLDEVDRMLDMGFLPVVKDIIGRCPKQRQTLFFSATVPPEIAAVASFALK
jgi:ATP-dependent RNA helicase RhlE